VSGDQKSGQWPTKQRRLEHVLRRKGYSWKEARKLASDSSHLFRCESLEATISSPADPKSGGRGSPAVQLSRTSYTENSARDAWLELMQIPLVSTLCRLRGGVRGGYEYRFRCRQWHDAGSSTPPLTQSRKHIWQARFSTRPEIPCWHTLGGELLYVSNGLRTSCAFAMGATEASWNIGRRTDRTQGRPCWQINPTIREVINARARTFDEFLILLDESQKFRE